MVSLTRELNQLKYDIMRQRGSVQAIRRQIKRIDGKEVIHSTPEADARRIMDECALVRVDLADKGILRAVLKVRETELNRLMTRRSEIKRILENRLPLTPCGLVIAIVKAKRRRQRELREYASKHLPQ